MAASRSGRILDPAANLAIILTCLVVCAVLVIRTTREKEFERVGLTALAPVFPSGCTIAAPDDVIYSAREFTVLVGLSSTCRYCQESMPFLRELDAEAWQRLGPRVRIVALGAEPVETLRTYLDNSGLSHFEARSVASDTPLSAVARRTPSIVVVDRHGSVVDTWPGLLTDQRLNEVLDHLKEPAPPQVSGGGK